MNRRQRKAPSVDFRITFNNFLILLLTQIIAAQQRLDIFDKFDAIIFTRRDSVICIHEKKT